MAHRERHCPHASACQAAVARCTLVAVLLAPAGVGAAELTLERVDIVADTTDGVKTTVALSFDGSPPSVPVYAMTDPDRIVVDLPDAKLGKGAKPERVTVGMVEGIRIDEKVIDGKPNVRIEVFLKRGARYQALKAANVITVVLEPQAETGDSTEIYRADRTSGDFCSIRAIEMKTLEDSLRIEVSFTSLPQAASIYMMESPSRVVMDFHKVFVDKPSEKTVNVAPVKTITVIKRDETPPFAGVVVHLDRTVPFRYEQVGDRVVVRVPLGGPKLTRRRTVMLIGAGIVAAGGVVTGILLGGGEEDGGPGGSDKPKDDDLGKPPEFPDF